MAIQYLTWPEAVDRICDQIERLHAYRMRGLELAQAAAVVGVSLATATRYQHAIDRLMADLETASGPARPDAAETDAPNPLKGVTAS